jgi:ubiquinone/menaquinone biosynthesis C-methylase UbiE
MPGFYATIARFYDAENADKTDDLVLYSQLAEEYGDPILEVGCGTGRVMLHLAQEGCEVHGIDSEPAMLERAERKRAVLPHLRDKLVFYQGDALKVEVNRRFKLVLLPYNGLMHFRDEPSQFALLRRLRQWTDDEGLLVLDLPNAGEAFATPDTGALTFERSFVEPESGHLVIEQSISYLDRTSQLLRVHWIYDEIAADGVVKRTFAPHLLRYFFLPEVRSLLEAVGFAVNAVYGDTEYSPFEDDSERMIIFAKPK